MMNLWQVQSAHVTGSMYEQPMADTVGSGRTSPFLISQNQLEGKHQGQPSRDPTIGFFAVSDGSENVLGSEPPSPKILSPPTPQV